LRFNLEFVSIIPPDLNPVEQIQKNIISAISQYIFKTLDALKEAISYVFYRSGQKIILVER